jgi:hypothetical protein
MLVTRRSPRPSRRRAGWTIESLVRAARLMIHDRVCVATNGKRLSLYLPLLSVARQSRIFWFDGVIYPEFFTCFPARHVR